MTGNALPEVLRIPVSFDTVMIMTADDPTEKLYPITPGVVEYIPTGHVADDGAHLYRMRNT
jgi:hypothetical protein